MANIHLHNVDQVNAEEVRFFPSKGSDRCFWSRTITLETSEGATHVTLFSSEGPEKLRFPGERATARAESSAVA